MVAQTKLSPPQAVQDRKFTRFLDPKSDLVFKKIFGQHPELVKSFLNGILPLPEGRLIEGIEYLTPEQVPSIPSMKNTIVDVKCTDQTGRIFIVEMQMTWSRSFFQRFLFGVSKAYVQQLDSGKEYGNLCPVYGLTLVNEKFEDPMVGWFHHYRFTHTEQTNKTLEGIELIFLELPKFTPHTRELRKIGALWLRFLQEIDAKSEKPLETIPEEFLTSPELMKAFELAEESAYTKAELAAYDEYLDAIRVVETIRVDSYKEGRKEGIGEGRKEEKYEIARLMVQKGKLLDEIQEFTGLTREELANLR